MTYQEMRYYSIMHDGIVSRLSSFVDGEECYVIVPVGSGKRGRELRDRALDMLSAAVESHQKGMVSWR